MTSSSKQEIHDEAVHCDDEQELCPECQAIFDNWYDRDDWESTHFGQLHRNIKDLKIFAQNGCSICELFMYDLDAENIRSLERDSPNTFGVISVTIPYFKYEITISFDVQKLFPTRLLYIGSSDIELHLCSTKDFSPQVEYLTLSHCWGKRVFSTLRKDNFEEFLIHIPSYNLCKTFQDAILATRKLGFKYLWIDSLCIIQDDEVDWKRESALMGYVYANSTLNLAALDSPDGSFGCFLERKPEPSIGCKVRANTNNTSNETSIWDCSIKYISSKLMSGILTSRAWVIQELFLSPRSLFFNTKELAFACRESTACETFPESYADGSLAFQACLRPNFGIAKLIALQLNGMRFSHGKVRGCRPLAGTKNQNEIESSPIPCRAPPWSWAAISTGISSMVFEKDNIVSIASLMEADTLVANDPYGEVTGGYIRLRCQVPCVGFVAADETTILPDITSRTGIWETFIYFNRYPYTIEGDSHFFPLLQQSDEELEAQIYGLVLRYVDEEDHYYRVGSFQLDNQSHVDQFQSIQRMNGMIQRISFKANDLVLMRMATRCVSSQWFDTST